jgi:hypothetical protein
MHLFSSILIRWQAAVAQSVGIVRLRTQAMEFSFFSLVVVKILCDDGILI